MKREKANYLIQSVSHALDVLEELAKVQTEIGVTELSKRLKLHKNNVFRLLATLELRGYAEQNKDTEDYRLGVKALQLGQAYLAQSALVARATPILKALSEQTGETVSLAVLQNGQVQFPVSVESKRPVRAHAREAVSFPAKQNAAGRLLTAHLSDAVLGEVLATNTPQDAAIKNQLNELRNTGQLIDRGIVEADVVAVTKIVRGNNNLVVGAIEVLSPQYRAKTETMLPLIEQAASALSSSLGASVKGLGAAIEREVSAQQPATQATSQQPQQSGK
ncbi:MAG: IclR family transcriptional regulator [Deltaproteobacteria bacterium]|nr:IclR family transcriptional regulator [Deltaproteobacteria bacterium]